MGFQTSSFRHTEKKSSGTFTFFEETSAAASYDVLVLYSVSLAYRGLIIGKSPKHISKILTYVKLISSCDALLKM